MEDTERTIIAVLNEGLIEFERLIPKTDKAFRLKHRAFNKNKIILFNISACEYRMFIYTHDEQVVETVEYDCMENTWSVFNSLSLMNAYADTKKKVIIK